MTSGFVTPKGFIPFDVDLYVKVEDCEPREFLTKNQRACILLDKTHASQPFFVVLVDTWYANKIVLGHCQRRGWQYITDIKSNRRFMYRKDSWRADKYAATLTDEACETRIINDDTYQFHDIEVYMDGLGDQLLVCSRRMNEETGRRGVWHFLLTSLRIVDPESVVRWYLKRWSIEASSFLCAWKNNKKVGVYTLSFSILPSEIGALRA